MNTTMKTVDELTIVVSLHQQKRLYKNIKAHVLLTYRLHKVTFVSNNHILMDIFGKYTDLNWKWFWLIGLTFECAYSSR